ncbi:hypothetical protein PAMA_021131 [Pampus argenteus]
MAGNSLDFLCILFGSGLTTILITAFPIAQISIGAAYLYECPVAPVIPVYVMVSGMWALLMIGLFALPRLLCPALLDKTIYLLCIFILFLMFFIWFFYGSYQIYSVHPPNYNKNIYPAPPDNKLNLTLQDQNQNHTLISRNDQTLMKLIQSLAVSNKTSRAHLNPPRARQLLYCNRTVYLFAFWTTTLVYVVVGKSLFMTICFYGFMKLT